ncbi:hemolysin family protein [Paracoccus sulfuroxidans]|uniref:Magnesium and cobalt transporter n=1 Tax=Paracoccus sulfuroxidans TaxID=384678 RepID=A0A562NL16_9RHOB|nr:hemolysin family protein [Paracoccus sulfuroxidans]TWI32813.1 magnesium and cobalt transporter [Paracoccus sulfuroxidans]
MNKDRSPDTSVSADPASWADGVAGDGRDLPQSRGLLERIFGAFGGGDSDEAGNSAQDDDIAPQHKLGMINLSRLRVDDVAVPKAEIVATSVETELSELVELFNEHGFSRIPVYRGSLDTPLGLILLKDLALKYGFGVDTPTEFALRPMLRPLLYVPPSMPIGVLLQQMQQKRIHMAMVIDEYGGVDGLVTIEDLIEQVIGQIEDEHDEVGNDMWVSEAPGQWLVQARAPLVEVEAATGQRLATDEEEDEIDTLGGLLFMLTGRVPVLGEVITHQSGVKFEVVDADSRRINLVRMRFPEAQGKGAE